MKMRKKFSIASVSVVLANSLVCSHAAASGHYEIWNNSTSSWSTGPAPGLSTKFSGQVYFSYAGGSLPCNITMTWLVLNGGASITDVSVTGNASCDQVSTSSLPWSLVSPLVSSGTSATATIFSVYFSVPWLAPGMTCDGYVSGNLTWNNSPVPGPPSTYGFTETFLSGCQFAVNPNPLSTMSYPKIRAVDP